jgi:hypothetical protein
MNNVGDEITWKKGNYIYESTKKKRLQSGP